MLPSNHVDLWQVELNGVDVRDFETLLTEDERKRAARYRFERHRREYVIARGALRHLLSAYTAKPPDALRFTYGTRGKPAHNGDVQFNVSRTSGLVLIGFSQLQLGVDVERVDKYLEWEPIARHFLSPEDRACIDAQPLPLRTEAFFRCWTRWEAYVKGLGQGLETAKDLCLGGDLIHSADGRAWSVKSIAPSPGYLAAISAEAERFTISSYEWKFESGRFPDASFEPASCTLQHS